MPKLKPTAEEKNKAVIKYLKTRFPEGEMDSYGNIKYLRNGKVYRLKPKTRVVRHEVNVDMGDHKEWVLMRSYNVNGLYERSLEE